MAISTSPTTEIEAVNTMLMAIGESPVNSLGSGLPDAEIAERILSETNRAVQSLGWNFNTELKWSLVPDIEGSLYLPQNCLNVDDRELVRHGDYDYVLRGQRLYDRINHTYAIGKAVEVDMIALLDFLELPEAARSYITIRSARLFQDRVLGSTDIHTFVERDEEVARRRLNSFKYRNGDYNMKNNSTVFNMLDRRL